MFGVLDQVSGSTLRLTFKFPGFVFGVCSKKFGFGFMDCGVTVLQFKIKGRDFGLGFSL